MDPYQLLQTGGVAALAILVYLELRLLRPVLRSLDLAINALLERERAKTGPVRRITHHE